MVHGKDTQPAIKALVFDAYGTLFDVNSVIGACNEVFPEHGKALGQVWRAKQLEYTWLLSLMGRYEDFWQVTGHALSVACKILKLPCDTSVHARLMEAYLSLEAYPEVHQALAALSTYPLAILSNGSPRMLQAAVESTGLERTFAYILSADDMRIYKPSPRVYQLAPQKLGVDAAAIGFVSANAWDVSGAKSFGCWTGWVNRTDQPQEELGFTPDVTIKILTELAHLLQVSPPSQG